MDDAERKSSVELAHERQLPPEMLQKLHDATEKFHHAKKILEAAMGETDYSHQKSIEKAAEDLRGAEREMEEITQQIHNSLKPPPAVTPTP